MQHCDARAKPQSAGKPENKGDGGIYIALTSLILT
jgi:hypothetical protein